MNPLGHIKLELHWNICKELIPCIMMLTLTKISFNWQIFQLLGNNLPDNNVDFDAESDNELECTTNSLSAHRHLPVY